MDPKALKGSATSWSSARRNRPDLIDPAILRPGENEDLPNTSNPDDWAKIAGRKGERIVAVKSLVGLARALAGFARGVHDPSRGIRDLARGLE